jgi:hypothetical protein
MRLTISRLGCIVYLACSAMTSCFAVQPDGRTIYWNEVIPGGGPGGNSALNLLRRSRINGGSVETISTDTTSRLTELAFEPSSQHLYWTVGGFIKRANADGTNVEDVITSSIAGQQTTIRGLDLDPSNSKMYWTDSILRSINRAELSGANAVVLFDGNDIRPSKLVLDSAGSRLFFENNGEGGSPEGPIDKVSAINLDGSEFHTTVSGIVQLNGIDIDPIAQKLYWVDLGFNALNDTAIRRANLDGSGTQTVLSNLPDVIIDIHVDPLHNAIYWTSRDEGLIKKSDLNGGNVQIIRAGLNEPHALLIIPEPATILLFLLSLSCGPVVIGRAGHERR